ncbi:glycoside hydrolase family 19 protein [Mucilaginibacter sabulilitoris]|uniref:Glycoside hydrolase family 19 protein n=1 Tax=Mucilaginibacter sabulilitoris TaxID=1173583 RepID=A0ABZ0TLH8_9SPHI|nr:glycoside hydrolase family 19 protein [Mucilaginibacter sabulilitoris]WPU93576.1 glycoside hydrolase family 19 protein [Mucilaginibacter sabulilitoris]
MPGKEFYNDVRPLFGGQLKQSQVDGMEAISKAIEDAGITDERKAAYIYATIFHECAKTMQPIAEFGKGAGHDYGRKLKMGAGPGHRIPYTAPDQLYYGRGYVQLTWYENYDNMGKLLHIDLLNNPELALEPSVAAAIMIKGMTAGLFTGKSLGDFFNNDHTDWINARRIINGLDHAQTIAGYAEVFHKGLTEVVAEN